MKIPTSRKFSNQPENARRASRKLRHFALAVGLGLLLSASPGLQAQTIWNGTGTTGGDGNWTTAADWSAGVPTTLVDTRFEVDVTRPTAAAAIAVTGTQAVKGLRVGLGKSVTLNMADGASLDASGLLGVGASVGTGTGPASLTIQGPGAGSATISHIRFDVVNSSSMVVTGNVSGTGTGDSSVGRGAPAQGSSSLSILNGASVGLGPLSVGRGSSDNFLLVSGTGSSLTMSTTLNVGMNSPGFPNVRNSARAENGGQIIITSIGGLGQGTGAHSNYFEVTGSNSALTSETIRVGDQTASPGNIGGNYLRVAAGGTAKMKGALDINNYDDSSTNFGSNYVLVDANGTLTSQNNINVKEKGALRLAATGKIEGRTTAGVAATAAINVLADGRFEAAGAGLGATTTVNTTINSGGFLAVGLDTAVVASTLSLSNTSSKMTLNTGSFLEFGLFGNGLNDSIAFTSTNIMTIGTGVNLRLTLQAYSPADGNSWTLLTGSGFATGSAGNLAAATFDLPTLGGGLSWDTTKFNETDGWMVSVVPEPSSLMLLGISLGTLLFVRRRRA